MPLLLLAVLLASCRSAPRINTSAPDPERLAERVAAEEPAHPRASAEDGERSAAALEAEARFFNFDPLSAAADDPTAGFESVGEGPDPGPSPMDRLDELVERSRPPPGEEEPREPSGPAPETSPAELATAPGEWLATAPEEQLITELRRRLVKEWSVVAQSFFGGEELAEEYRGLQRHAARRLLALSFLADAEALEAEADPDLEAALDGALRMVTGSNGDRPTRLLAAARLDRVGREEELFGVLATLSTGQETSADDTRGPAGAGTPSTPESGDRGVARPRPFEVVNLSFARSIQGPGDFRPLRSAEVRPGKEVLVYGEFRGYHTRDGERNEEGPTYACSFSASLHLVGPRSSVVERVDFLPSGRGAQVVSSKEEIVNFWARYEIPGRLRPGRYRLEVHARDVLGDAVTTGTLHFDVERP